MDAGELVERALGTLSRMSCETAYHLSQGEGLGPLWRRCRVGGSGAEELIDRLEDDANGPIFVGGGPVRVGCGGCEEGEDLTRGVAAAV
jgi:hypothetical protein